MSTSPPDLTLAPRSLRFGFSHHPIEHPDRHAWLVNHAEALGFDIAWVPDQTFHRDPYVMLSRIADATERITLGLAVTNPWTRHPAVTARAIATVADLAANRLVLGIGAGNMREVVEALGLRQPGVASRVLEAVQVIRRLIDGETVTHAGTHFQLEGVALAFKPASAIPIFVAARGPELLEGSGEAADGVIIGSVATPTGWAYAAGRIAEGVARTGRSLDALTLVSWVGCEITTSAAEQAEALDRRRPSVAHVMGGAPPAVLAAIGVPESVVTAVKAAYTREGQAAAAPLVPDDCVQLFGIIGPGEYCAERVVELAAAGADVVSLLMSPNTPVETHAKRLERFAETVFPFIGRSRP